ncbi:MAG: MATE family efflux transporter [Ruminococcaceae bacterium]|nr:MATE family efflux transporter [Oscillospiraceae bacterium]
MEETKNPMGTKSISKLLFSLAVPAVIANLVNALYNIVDQIFIGHIVGYLGNAATNIAFPLTTICMAIGLMTGIGTAAGYNLSLGQKKEEDARKFAGTAFSTLIIAGIIICILVKLFLKPLMIAFGATENILEYAVTYSSITSFGIPFLLFSTGTNPIVRGDGSSTYSMISIVSGGILNIFLDALFMYKFNMGIAGAAWATVISQIVSALLLARYFLHFKNVKFKKSDFIPRFPFMLKFFKLGFSSFAFQSSMLIIQITVNNLLKKYGALSVYGSDVTIAVAGILQKINMIFLAFVIGIVQGAQPICSFNYGAQKYLRVRKTVKISLVITTVISIVMFSVMQLFPRQIVGIFGDGSDGYFEFAAFYARGFFACVFFNGVQIFCSTFFPAIGKPGKGTIIALSKQLIILWTLLMTLSYFFGLNGIIFAAPVTDTLTFILATSFLFFELKKMPKTDKE